MLDLTQFHALMTTTAVILGVRLAKLSKIHDTNRVNWKIYPAKNRKKRKFKNIQIYRQILRRRLYLPKSKTDVNTELNQHLLG